MVRLCFFEFGKLTPRVLKSGHKLQNDSGEMSLSITWSWRIENENSIVAGSWSDDSEWSKYFEQLLGSRVASASLFGRLPEIELSFSNGMYLCSMMTADGDPSRSISNRRAGMIESVSVVSGHLSWKSSEDDRSFGETLMEPRLKYGQLASEGLAKMTALKAWNRIAIALGGFAGHGGGKPVNVAV